LKVSNSFQEVINNHKKSFSHSTRRAIRAKCKTTFGVSALRELEAKLAASPRNPRKHKKPEAKMVAGGISKILTAKAQNKHEKPLNCNKFLERERNTLEMETKEIMRSHVYCQ